MSNEANTPEDLDVMATTPAGNQYRVAVAAKVIKRGSSDYGYVSAECDAPECKDLNGRPWQQSYSRRTVEGYRLAERDAMNHNQARHPGAS